MLAVHFIHCPPYHYHNLIVCILTLHYRTSRVGRGCISHLIASRNSRKSSRVLCTRSSQYVLFYGIFKRSKINSYLRMCSIIVALFCALTGWCYHRINRECIFLCVSMSIYFANLNTNFDGCRNVQEFKFGTIL